MRIIRFVPINLYESHSHRFLITDEGIRPPLNALQGVGINAAKSIVEARTQGEFISIEDLRERAKVTKTVIEALQQEGVLKNLPRPAKFRYSLLHSLQFNGIIPLVRIAGRCLAWVTPTLSYCYPVH